MTVTLDGLIARLEAAPEGNTELSALIARDVMGHKPHDWPLWFLGPSFDGRPFGAVVPVVPYTTSIDAALTLLPEWASVEMMRSAAGPPPFFSRCTIHDWHRMPRAFDAGNEWKSEGNRSLAISVCIASLKARAAARP